MSENVRQTYQKVCKRYRDGDELWYFGFSRRAYTVRSTLGMLRSWKDAALHPFASKATIGARLTLASTLTGAFAAGGR